MQYFLSLNSYVKFGVISHRVCAIITQGKTVEWAIRKYGNADIRWSAQGMLRLTQEAMRRLFMPTILRIKEAIGSVMVANSCSGLAQYPSKNAIVIS